MINILLVCSMCGLVGKRSADYQKGVHSMRSQLASKGWRILQSKTYLNQTGPDDYCPACWMDKKIDLGGG